MCNSLWLGPRPPRLGGCSQNESHWGSVALPGGWHRPGCAPWTTEVLEPVLSAPPFRAERGLVGPQGPARASNTLGDLSPPLSHHGAGTLCATLQVREGGLLVLRGCPGACHQGSLNWCPRRRTGTSLVSDSFKVPLPYQDHEAAKL